MIRIIIAFLLGGLFGFILAAIIFAGTKEAEDEERRSLERENKGLKIELAMARPTGGREKRDGMSRNAKKITKALAEKGYQPRETHWEPVGHACEMCGPEGGWYIEVETLSADADGDHDYVDTILAYSTAEALEGIAALPEAAQAGEGRSNGT